MAEDFPTQIFKERNSKGTWQNFPLKNFFLDTLKLYNNRHEKAIDVKEYKNSSNQSKDLIMTATQRNDWG